jgi:hypothetical protein
MSTAEKLEAMEQLWASLQTKDHFAHPQWHREVLEKRQGRIERRETTFSTLDEVRDRLRERRS